MKKSFSFLLLIMYGLSSTGMSLHLHYCCGKLDKVQFTSVKNMQCGMCHKMQNKSCCDDKQLDLKIKADQKAEQTNKITIQAPALTNLQSGVFIFNPLDEKKLVAEIFAPPPLQTPLNILHCIYRI